MRSAIEPNTLAGGRAYVWQETGVESRGTVRLEIALGNRIRSGLHGEV